MAEIELHGPANSSFVCAARVALEAEALYAHEIEDAIGAHKRSKLHANEQRLADQLAASEAEQEAAEAGLADKKKAYRLAVVSGQGVGDAEHQLDEAGRRLDLLRQRVEILGPAVKDAAARSDADKSYLNECISQAN